MIVEELIALLGFQTKGQGDLNRFLGGLKQARQGISTLQASIVGFAGGFGAGVAMETLNVIGQALKALPTSVVQTGMEFQDLSTTLEVLEGSAQKAKAGIDWVTDFAARTPFDLKQVSEAFVKMRAYGLDPMDGSLKALGDAASGLNKPIMAAVEAMADAITGENERLKEFGVRTEKVGDQFVYTWTKNGKTLTRTVKNNAKDIQRALTDILNDRFMGMMDRKSQDMRGILANIGDRWQGFKRKIGEKGFFAFVQREFQGLLRVLDDLERTGKLDQWATDISMSMEGAARSVGDSALWIRDRWREVPQPIKDAITEIKDFRANTEREWEAIKAFFGGGLNFGENTAREFETVRSTIESFRQWVETINLAEAGAKMMQSLWDGMKGVADSMLEWARGIGDRLRSSLGGVPSMGLPSGSAPVAPGGTPAENLGKELGKGILGKQSSLTGPRRPGGNTYSPTVNVNVAGTNASAQQIADRTADALKRLYFTSDSPATA